RCARSSRVFPGRRSTAWCRNNVASSRTASGVLTFLRMTTSASLRRLSCSFRPWPSVPYMTMGILAARWVLAKFLRKSVALISRSVRSTTMQSNGLRCAASSASFPLPTPVILTPSVRSASLMLSRCAVSHQRGDEQRLDLAIDELACPGQGFLQRLFRRRLLHDPQCSHVHASVHLIAHRDHVHRDVPGN